MKRLNKDKGRRGETDIAHMGRNHHERAPAPAAERVREEMAHRTLRLRNAATRGQSKRETFLRERKKTSADPLRLQEILQSRESLASHQL